MDEVTINTILNNDKKLKNIYLGTLARDELPKKLKYPSCFILNTHPRNGGGEHWLALFYDANGICDYFDSYGFPPSMHNLKSYIKSTSKKCRWNKRRIQGASNYCGLYCIYFLKYRSRQKYNNLFFKNFIKDFDKNDLKIFKYFN